MGERSVCDRLPIPCIETSARNSPTEMNTNEEPKSFPSSLAPWLSVRNSARAVAFYQAAFGAVETYRLEDPAGGVVSRLSIAGSEFWLSDESPEHDNFSPETLGGSTVRLILTVADPQTVFARALQAGAVAVHPVSEAHGWLTGRLQDPFGHCWEIGRPTTD